MNKVIIISLTSNCISSFAWQSLHYKLLMALLEAWPNTQDIVGIQWLFFSVNSLWKMKLPFSFTYENFSPLWSHIVEPISFILLSPCNVKPYVRDGEQTHNHYLKLINTPLFFFTLPKKNKHCKQNTFSRMHLKHLVVKNTIVFTISLL